MGAYCTYFYLFSDFHRYNNDADLGMKSGIGLKPPRISTRELKSPETSKLGLVSNPFISRRALIYLFFSLQHQDSGEQAGCEKQEKSF